MTWAESLLAEREEERRSAEQNARERIARAVGELYVVPKRGSIYRRQNVHERAAEIAQEDTSATPPECVRRAILSMLQDAPDGPEKLTPAELDLARERFVVEWSVYPTAIGVGWKEDPNG